MFWLEEPKDVYAAEGGSGYSYFSFQMFLFKNDACEMGMLGVWEVRLIRLRLRVI